MRSSCHHVFPILRLLVLLGLTFTLCACVSTSQNLSGKQASIATSLAEGNSVVFGKIHWIENGKEKKIGKGLFDFYIKPSLLRLEDKTRTLAEVGENGQFVWALAPGTYVINRLEYRDNWSGNYFFVPQVGFRVHDPQKTYYIGQLDAEFTSERDLIGGLSGNARFKVVDHSAVAYPIYADKAGTDSSSLEKSLMVHEKNLPRTFDTTAEFNLGMQLLNAILSGM